MPVSKYFFKEDSEIMDVFESELSTRIHNFKESAKASGSNYPDSPDFRNKMTVIKKKVIEVVSG